MNLKEFEKSRNPFVSQVFSVIGMTVLMAVFIAASQSLRKSGLFRPKDNSDGTAINRLCRNPFVSQVFSVFHFPYFILEKVNRSRNPFVSQVFSV